MFMNRYDIEESLDILSRRRSPALPYARFLDGWREVVDNNSDGWGTWGPGTACARRLSALVHTAVEVARGFTPAEDMPKEAMFRSALTPIRQFASKKGLPAPEFQAADAEPAPAPRMR